MPFNIYLLGKSNESMKTVSHAIFVDKLSIQEILCGWQTQQKQGKVHSKFFSASSKVRMVLRFEILHNINLLRQIEPYVTNKFSCNCPICKPVHIEETCFRIQNLEVKGVLRLVYNMGQINIRVAQCHGYTDIYPCKTIPVWGKISEIFEVGKMYLPISKMHFIQFNNNENTIFPPSLDCL